MKNEFLTALDGALTDRDKLVLLVGATNMPEQIDQAAQRRFAKKLFIPLPGPSPSELPVARRLAKDGELTNLSNSFDCFTQEVFSRYIHFIIKTGENPPR